MSKYDRLADFLANHSEAVWDASFADVERVIRNTLPASASTYREWWANQNGAGHSQARAWMETGWRVGKVELDRGRVEFRRAEQGKTRRSPTTMADDTSDDDAALFETASRWLGIDDRDALVRAGLTALIEREAARRLALRGGTMPNFEAPPRRRPE